MVIASWTQLTGNFHGPDPTRVYFGHDKANLINYTIICPLYVGLSAALVVLACKSWVRQKLDSPLTIPGGMRSPRLPLAVAFFIVIGLSAALTCNYIAECLDPSKYAKVFWFISAVDPQGQRVLGALGVYYALLTYSLFLTALSATISLIPLFAIAAEVGRCFRSSEISAPDSFDTLRGSLSDFISAYLVAKAFTAVLMLNVFTWRWMEPRHSFNLLAMGTVLTIVGIFFISVPRYYIEHEWFALSVRRAQAAGEPPPTEANDLRSRNVRLFAHLLDTLLIGGFATAFWLK